MTSVAGPSRVAPHVPAGHDQHRESHLYRSIAGLSEQDIDELERDLDAAHRGNRPLTDGELAVQLSIEEARQLARFNEDRLMAFRLAQEAPDVQTIRTATPGAPGRVAPAIVTNNPGNPRPRQPVQGQNAQQNYGWLSSVVTTVSSWFAGYEIASPQANGTQTLAAPTAQTKAPAGPSGHNCVICMDAIIDVDIGTPCGHHYDKGCILDLFESATKDESLFPPRCCKRQIPLSSVQTHMSADLLQRFNDKSKEFSTLKRVYCANPVCSHFLGPQQDSTASWSFFSSVPTTKACPAAGCITTTCLRCKNKVTEPLHSCTENTQDSQVLNLGRAAGWARCPGCETMIELNHGCFHMTCRCRTEFCYVCKARWKTCRCPQWDERRLMAAAEARADAQLGRQAAQREAPRPAPVRAHFQPPPVRTNLHPPPAQPPAQVADTVSAQGALPTRTPLEAMRDPYLEYMRLFQAVERRAATTAATASAPHTGSSEIERRTAVTPAWTPTRVVPRSAQVVPPSNTRTETSSTRTAAPPSSAVAQPKLATPSTKRASSAFPLPVFGASSTRTRDELVHDWMERLRVDHDCDHLSWRYQRGAGRCQTCHNHLPLYLYLCKGCEIRACRRCRMNRL